MTSSLLQDLQKILSPQDLLYAELLRNMITPLRRTTETMPLSRGDTGVDFVHYYNLYYPAVSSPHFQLGEKQLLDHIDGIAHTYLARVKPFLDWRIGPSAYPISPQDCTFSVLSEEQARVLLEHFHYLSSFRSNSIHLGLTYQGFVASIVTFSEFDMENIKRNLPRSLSSKKIMTLSRFYSLPWAPKNTTSYLIAKGVKWLKNHYPDLDLILTYLNPNIGFDGTSYRAANFVLFGKEDHTRPSYLDGAYVTQRDLIARYGTFSERKLRRLVGDRILTSRAVLEPLHIYAYFYTQELKNNIMPSMPLSFQKPKKKSDYLSDRHLRRKVSDSRAE